MDLSHIISPYSRVIEYSAPPNNGFYTFPHNDDHPQGWGKPFIDEEGNPIDHPGTPLSSGGKDPIWALVYRDNEWQTKREPGNWLYGNIDWRGPILAGSSPYKRRKLSYFGPNTRYFSSPNFTYGSEDKHHEIYQNGQYAAIAPKPVLGAAIMVWFNPDTQEEEEHLVVVCRDGTGDVVYSRPKPALVGPAAMTPALRSEMMQIANPPERPEGWVWVTGIARQVYAGEEALVPSTPWFFSSDGMEAQCMREMEKTFNNGIAEVKEIGVCCFKLSFFSPYSATFINLGNEDGYETSIKATKASEPHIKINFAFDASSYGPPGCNECPLPDVVDNKKTSHYFGVDHIRAEAKIRGKYIVAVDYHEDEEVLVYCHSNADHTYHKWWRYCIDNTIGQVFQEDYPFNATDGDYREKAYNGVLWDTLSWWWSNGDWEKSLDCNVCTLSDGDLAAYLSSGFPVPPYIASGGYRSAFVSFYSSVYLEWVHPVAGKSTLTLHKSEVGTRDVTVGGVEVEDAAVVAGSYIFSGYLYHLDVRLSEGAFAAARGETIESVSDGKAFYYYNNNGVLPTRADDPYHYNTYGQGSKFKITEKVTQEVIDPFSGQGLSLTMLDEGVQYTAQDAYEHGSLDEMQAWYPANANVLFMTQNQPNVVNATSGHDWRRYDFEWDYSYLSVDGHYAHEQELLDAGLEPHVENLFGLESNTYRGWLGWRELLCSEKNYVEGGFAWQDGVGVCFSYTYNRGLDGSGIPMFRPVTEEAVFAQPIHVNYITNGDLSAIIDPGDRCYPIGVM